MDALAVAFDTNISGDEISKFVKYELNNLPKWKIESYAIVADSDYQFCYQSQSYASVVMQNDVMNEIAKEKIQAVLDGKSSSTVKDTSGFSQTPNADNAKGNTEELESMGIINNSPSYDYNYDNDYSYDNSQDYSQDYNQDYNQDYSYDNSYQDDSYYEQDYD